MVDTAADLAVAQPGAVPASAHADLPPLKVRQMSVFSIGDALIGIKDSALGTFLLFYLTAVVGLSGKAAGLILFISLTVDAVADPLIGYISDTTRSRWGRRHPYMLGAAVPLFLGFGLLFSIPAIGSQWGLFAYVLAVLLLLRISNSAFTLPYSAVGAEISRDYKERSALGSVRTLFNVLGNFVCIGLGFGVFMSGESGLLDRGAYVGFGWACAAIAAVAGLTASLGTLTLRHRMHATPAEPVSPRRFIAEIGQVFAARSFRSLFLTILVFWAAEGATVALTLHVNRYFWDLPAAIVAALPTALVAGLAVGILVAGLALRFFEKHQVCVAALGLFCVLQGAPVILRLMGLLPESGPLLHAILIAVAFVGGWTVTCVIIAFVSMMADAADEHEYLYGSRREALYFAGLTFSLKAAVGLGGLAGGLALDAIGFPKNIAALGAHPEIAPETLRNLGLIAGPGAAAVAAIGAVILAGYRLSASRHAEIVSELARRRDR